MRPKRAAWAIGGAGLALAVAAGCTRGGPGGRSVALLLPEAQTARYEAADRPFFEAKFAALCPGAQVIYANANQAAADQQRQAEAAIARGVGVLVLDPVDAEAAGAIALAAQARSIPVISYDRLVRGGAAPDYYVSFDNEQVGRLQAQALLEKLSRDGVVRPRITMIDGSPTDGNAELFKRGAHSVFDGNAEIVREGAAANWKPEEAQQLMEQFIAALRPDGFDAAYQANDGTAGGAIAALKAAGIDPKTKPSIGQDAELAAIQRILAGEQYATVYKRIQPQAERAAELACGLLRGERPAPDSLSGTANNGTAEVPAVLLQPVAVTLAGGGMTQSVADTVLRDRFYGPDSAARICRGFEGGLRRGEHPVATAVAEAAGERAPLLELRGICKRFGAVSALRGVDLEVRAGEVLALVGDNGAGKSTLVKLIAGTHRPDAGELRWCGRAVAPRSPAEAAALGIAVVYQDLALCDNLDVVANLFLGRELGRRGGPFGAMDELAMERRALELLARLSVRLPSVRTPIAALSGGQRQSVAVARSVLGESRLVLLDEPTAALGAAQAREVLALIGRLRAQGLGVVLISHNLADVFEVADRIAVLRLGRAAGVFAAREVGREALVALMTGATGPAGEP